MNAERWKRVREVFELALDQPPDERLDAVRREVGEDRELLVEVERLLEAEREPAPEFEAPAQASVSLDDEPPASLEPGDELGGFRILRRLATGGMGDVYLADQSKPERRVAVKVLRSSGLSERARRRFEFEAEVLGRLLHPSIATVFEAGTTSRPDGRPVAFFAMEYVREARTVLEYARAAQLDRAARIELFLEVCRAIRFAHEQGVLHRDIKPTNLLVDAEGRPRVIDFGIARSVRPHPDPATLTGEVFGTIGYLSPERIAGARHGSDVRSDVYSLGVVLYELIAGAPPHDLRELALGEALEVVREREPRFPSDLAPELPVELDWIASKAVARDRERRYASVADLIEDLESWRVGGSIAAGSPSTVYRVRSFLRRHRFAAAIGLIAVAGTLATVYGTGVGLERARQADALSTQLEGVFESILEGGNAEYSGADLQVSALLQRLSNTYPQTLEGSPDALIRLHRSTARAWKSLNDVGRARELVSAGLALCEAGHGTLLDRASLTLLEGKLVEDERDPAGALALFDRALELARGLPAGTPRRALVAKVEEARARPLFETGSPKEAFECLERSGRTATELGDTALVAHGAWVAGLLHRIERDYEAAGTAYDRGLAAIAAAPDSERGPLFTLRLELLAEKAQLLSNLGRYAEALALAEDFLPVASEWLGPFHPEMVSFRLRTAMFHAHAGDYATATARLEELEEASRFVALPERDLLDVRAYLVQFYKGLGRAEEALALSDRVIEQRTALYGEHHLATLQDHQVRASILFALDRVNEGARAYETVVEDMRLHVADPFYAADALGRLATLLCLHEQDEEAAPLAERAETDLAELVAGTHPALFEHRLMRAQLLHRMGRTAEARAVVARMEASLDEDATTLQQQQAEALRSLVGES